MPVTNFQSVISAQSVGTADVQALAASFDKLSGSIDSASKKSDKLNEHPGFNAFAEKVKAGIENPLQGIASVAGEALQSLGPLGTAVAATGGMFAAAAIATFEAAKSLGEYGVRIRDVELKTGLAAKEVGQFGFAAKAVGQDVSVVERAMRGLTMAVTEQGEKGAAARGWLQRFGVDLSAVRDGSASTSAVLQQISEGLGKLPSQWDRNRAAIDIFKRAGIELLPFLIELRENMKTAGEQGFGFSDGDVSRWTAINKQIAEIETHWEEFKQSAKEGVVISVRWLANLIPTPDSKNTPEAQNRGSNERQLYRDIVAANNLSWSKDISTPPEGTVQYYALMRQRALRGVSPMTAFWGDPNAMNKQEPTNQESASLKQAALYQQKIEELQKNQGEAEKKRADDRRRADAEQDAAVHSHAQALNEQRKAIIEAARQTEVLGKRSQELYSAGFFSDSGPAGKYNLASAKIEADRAADLKKMGLTPGLRNQINQDFDLQKTGAFLTFLEESGKALRKFRDEVQEGGDKLQEMFWGNGTPDDIGSFRSRGLKQAQEFEKDTPWIFQSYPDVMPPPGPSPRQQLRDARQGESRFMGLYGMQAQYAGLTPGQQVGGEYSSRLAFADKEYKAELRIAEQHATEAEKQIARQDALDQRDDKYFQARLERDQKLLDMALRQKETFQQGVVDLVGALQSGNASGLLSSWGRGFENKVVGNAAGMAWGSVSKLIPHAQDGGTMGKLLSGTPFGPDPLKGATDMNTMATAENTRAMLTFSARLSMSPSGGGGGFSPGTFASLFAGGGDMGGVLPTDYNSHPYDNAMIGAGINPEMNPARSGLSGLAKGVGIAGAGAAGAYGAYRGFSQGGARGALSGAGSLAGAAGSIMMLSGMTGPAAPIVAGVGLALAAFSSIFGGDKRKERQNDLETQRQQRMFSMPTGADYGMDTHGNYSDYDYRGQSRSSTINVYAMDAGSFKDFLVNNPDALSAGMSRAISSGNGEDVVGALQQRISA